MLIKPRAWYEFLLRGVAISGVLFISVSAAEAQETSVIGRVTDATQAALPGVTITATHEDTGNVFSAVTDGQGGYRLGELRPGLYELNAELSGFAVVRKSISLLLGQQGTLNFEMGLSAIEESVTVTGEAPLIDVTQSAVGGSIDPVRMQELPINGRNWMTLSMMAPGSRSNLVSSDAPTGQGNRQPNPGDFQVSVDGQQTTQMMSSMSFGQPKFSREAIAEMQVVTSRFDATLGRSSGMQVLAITKAGTNRYSGSASGYFRDSKWNAPDFIAKRVLPYSDQQLVGTFGGPIRKNKIHFFGFYEYEREPQTIVHTTAYPSFNLSFDATRVEKNGGGRADVELTSNTRFMVRANYWRNWRPLDPGLSGGNRHPSADVWADTLSKQVFGTLNSILGSNTVNEFGAGFIYVDYEGDSVIQQPGAPIAGVPAIVLQGGPNIGTPNYIPIHLRQKTAQFKDEFTTLFNKGGRHQLKLGGEYLYNLSQIFAYRYGLGELRANLAPPPDNLEDLLPVWNDPSTWNLAPLSPISLVWRQAVTKSSCIFCPDTWDLQDPQHFASLFVQDDWSITENLVLNLGLRWDYAAGAFGEGIAFPPFLSGTRKAPLDNFGPRLGFAYSLNDETVLRGGFGRYYGQISDIPTHTTKMSIYQRTPNTPNDGRPNFAADPYNITGGGHAPTFEEAGEGILSYPAGMASEDYSPTFSYQTSVGFQRQVNQVTSVQADYVYIGERNLTVGTNVNVGCNMATGVPFPPEDTSQLPYPQFGTVWQTVSSDLFLSNYHSLQTGVTKRLSSRWQLSGTYTLGMKKDQTGVGNPCDLLDPQAYRDRQYAFSEQDQRHRLVLNGLVLLPFDLQVSGVYFYGSGVRYAQTVGGDPFRCVCTDGRLGPDGTYVERNGFLGSPLHRVDLRVSRRVRMKSGLSVEGMVEVFNAFNHANYGSYITAVSSSLFGVPVQNADLAYAPRMMQLGFRVLF